MGEKLGGEKNSEEKKTEKVKDTEVEKPAAEDKPKGVENNEENNKENKESKEEKQPPPPPPPPPPEIVLRVHMHCEGCARKVRKCLKDFNGVENVTTDCKTHIVVVKGEKADPLKVLDRVQKKTHRRVELLSPIPVPKPPIEEPTKIEEKEPPKPEEQKPEPKVITVVLKVHMHCEACSLEIKKHIERMKEVEEAIPDLKSSQVIVKGTFEATKLVEYVYKRIGRHATIIKQDPPPETKDDEKKGENGEDGKKGDQKGEEGGGEGRKGEADGGDGVTAVEEGPRIMELKRNEFNYYPPRYGMDMYAYPPQIFSDENPNACSIM